MTLRHSRALLLLGMVLLLDGCAGFAARQIEHPGDPFAGMAKAWAPQLAFMGFRHRTQDVAPGMRIAYWQFEPKHYGFVWLWRPMDRTSTWTCTSNGDRRGIH